MILSLPNGELFLKRTAAELKLAGIMLKRPKMQREHQKFKQGEDIRTSDVFLLLFLTPNNMTAKIPIHTLNDSHS